MVSGQPVRLFESDAAIRRVGEGFLARTLDKAEWTHEAHLGTTAWLLIERPDITAERALPGLIRAYNVSQGGENTDSAGYHETITQAYVTGIRAFLRAAPDGAMCARINALLTGPVGAREWPLRFWSREVLFSVPARRGWVPPDLAPISL